MPAMLPNAKCGNLAVPPDTGYIPPSSAWTSARMTTMIPAMTHPSKAAVPAACAANSAPNSQPEPMMEVSDAQVAPISPISRRRPTSAGWLTGAPADPVSVAMIDALFSILPRGACSPPSGWVASVPYEQSEIIVGMIITYEKCCRGFGFITQFRALYPAYGRNNDTCAASHRDGAVITREFHRDRVLRQVLAGRYGQAACESIHESKAACRSGRHLVDLR